MKTAGHAGAWALLWVAGGCSEVIDFGVHCEPPNPLLNVAVRGPDPTTYAGICASRADFATLQATLRIDGHLDFALDVDPVTLETSGVTTTYTGIPLRSALVTYSLTQGSARIVGFHVAVLDLTDPRCDAHVELDLQRDGVAWFDAATIEAAAGGSGGVLVAGGADADPGLAAAVAWALAKMVTAPSLDSDGDGCPNLNEACRGTLFDDAIQQTCP